jgi:hypothetical protein
MGIYGMGVYGSALLQHPSGGVVMLVFTQIYFLPHAGPDARWTLMPQRIKTYRNWLTAFVIPDDVANCV